jgi:integrase
MLKDLNLIGGMTNKDWLDQVHDEMRANDITQGQLADMVNYSRSHLNQLLGRKKPLNDKARLELTLALRALTGQNNLDVCIDYLGVTFKTHDYEELIDELFQISPIHFNLHEGAHYGYSATLICGEINIMLSKKAKIHFWTQADFRKVLATMNTDTYTDRFDYTMLWFMFMSGLRSGEARALKWTDVDLEAKTVNVNKTMDFTTATGLKRLRQRPPLVVVPWRLMMISLRA